MIRVLAALAVGAALVANAAQAQNYDRDVALRALSHAGVARSVGLYVPVGYSAEHPAPLIVALHGRFSSAKAFHALSGLAAVAEARGAIVVYPETAGGFWNDGGDAALRREAAQDDAGFVAAAIEAVAAEYAIDRARIYLVGYDVGGGLAYRLICEGGARFSGAAVVSALLWDYGAQACAAAAATPILILHGRRDDIFPVRGGVPGGPVTARRLSADETIAFWRNVNGCAGRASAGGRGGSAYYAACRDGAAVAYVGIEGGSHDWFRAGPDYALNQHGVDAAAVIDGFLFDRANFRLPPSRAGSRRSRSWIVYAPPSYDRSTPMPAVVMLHGRPSTATGMALITRMHEVAARRGFIVVYPEGIDNEWNAQFDLIGRDSLSLGGARAVLPQDDVAFLKTLMSDLRVDLNVDPRRMYVAGFSNGGFMTLRLACSASDVFAGFAEVGAALYTVMTDTCRRSPPSPILLMHGSVDLSIPYDGVEARDSRGGEPTRITLSVPNTVALFATRNHCSLSGASTTFAESGNSPGTHVIRFAPHGCDPGAPVEFWLINGGGHQWPGVPGVLPEENFGPLNLDINAGEVIWDFLSRQSLPERR